jgi:hypothetical protein
LELPQTTLLNEEFNDKGLIFIRHGEPDDKVVTSGEFVPTNESWLYYESDNSPQMTFHFMMEDPRNGWRFTPLINHPQMLEDRLQWGSIYYQLLNSEELGKLSFENRMIEESKEAVKTGLSTDQHSWDKDLQSLNVAVSLDAFRGKDGKTSVELAYSIPLATLFELSEKENLDLKVEKGFALHKSRPLFFTKLCDTLQFQDFNSQFFLGFYKLNLSPNVYNISFHAKPINLNYLGSLKIKKDVENFFQSDLNISDIQLASLVEPATFQSEFVKNDLLVVPNPNHNFDLNNPLYLYFEIYNLSQNANNRTLYTIEYVLSSLKQKKSGLSNLFGLFGGGKDYSVSIQNYREGESEFSVEYLAMDISKAKPGMYDLRVKIIDKLSGSNIERSSRVVLK